MNPVLETGVCACAHVCSYPVWREQEQLGTDDGISLLPWRPQHHTEFQGQWNVTILMIFPDRRDLTQPVPWMKSICKRIVPRVNVSCCETPCVNNFYTEHLRNFKPVNFLSWKKIVYFVLAAKNSVWTKLWISSQNTVTRWYNHDKLSHQNAVSDQWLYWFFPILYICYPGQLNQS